MACVGRKEEKKEAKMIFQGVRALESPAAVAFTTTTTDDDGDDDDDDDDRALLQLLSILS